MDGEYQTKIFKNKMDLSYFIIFFNGVLVPASGSLELNCVFSTTRFIFYGLQLSFEDWLTLTGVLHNSATTVKSKVS